MKRAWAILFLLLLAACIKPQPQTAPAPPIAPAPEDTGKADLQLIALNVGQGDSILIRAPNGKNILYDGGRSKEGVLEALQDLGVGGLELVIASHPDADHIGGLAAVMRRYRPKYFMDNAIPHTTQTYADLLVAIEEAGSQVLSPTARRIGVGKVSLDILPPPLKEAFDNNDNSVGLRVSYGCFSALLTGDAGEDEVAWWLTHAANLYTPVSVYKAAHHGSATGDGELAVSHLKPRAVLLSVGADNSYGHPAKSVLDLYGKHSARVFRTDLLGSLQVKAAATGAFSVAATQVGGGFLPLERFAAPQAAYVPGITPSWSAGREAPLCQAP